MKKLVAGLFHFNKWMVLGFAADHENGWRVLQVERSTQILFGLNLSRKLALWIYYKRQIHFVIGGKLIRELAQVRGKISGWCSKM